MSARQVDPTVTTHRLLLRLKEGDRAALDLLIGRLVQSARRWARGRLPLWAREGADTADVVQEAATRVASRLDSFEPQHRNALRAYFRRAIQNDIRDRIRRARRRGLAQPLDETYPDGKPLVDQVLITTEEEHLVDAALLRLTPSERELVVARIHRGMTFDQIALATGKPSADAARMAVKRALIRLAQVVGDR